MTLIVEGSLCRFLLQLCRQYSCTSARRVVGAAGFALHPAIGCSVQFHNNPSLRLWTAPVRTGVKLAIDAWISSAGVADGYVFRPVNRADRVAGERLGEKWSGR